MNSSTPFPSGVITATITPMDRDLNADIDALMAHCNELINKGCNGIVLLGTTGEANSFSVHERKAIIEGVLQTGFDPNLLMVGTGCCAITDTVELTKHACQSGAKNVLMLPPFYYKPVSDEALFRYYAYVIENVGDNDLQIYLYHIPPVSGVPITAPLIIKLIEAFPGIIAGIKDSGGDWNHMRELIRTFPSFRVYAGSEEFLLDTLKEGGVGCISATANVTISSIAEVFRQYQQGEDARDAQAFASSLRKVFTGRPFVSILKGVLVRERGLAELNNMRPPNIPLSDEVIEDVVKEFRSVGSDKGRG